MSPSWPVHYKQSRMDPWSENENLQVLQHFDHFIWERSLIPYPYCIVSEEEDDGIVDDGSGIVDVDEVMVIDDDTTGTADTTGTSAENITVTFGDVIAFQFSEFRLRVLSPMFSTFN